MTLPIAERKFIDPTTSYHGAITGKEAVKRLKKADGDFYLTRFSHNHGCYFLTVIKCNPSMMVGQFPLHIDKNSRRQCCVKGMESSFGTIDELLTHYETNRIHPMFDNIGRRLTLERYTNIQQRCFLQ